MQNIIYHEPRKRLEGEPEKLRGCLSYGTYDFKTLHGHCALCYAGD